jgi:hypothetical protein
LDLEAAALVLMDHLVLMVVPVVVLVGHQVHIRQEAQLHRLIVYHQLLKDIMEALQQDLVEVLLQIHTLLLVVVVLADKVEMVEVQDLQHQFLVVLVVLAFNFQQHSTIHYLLRDQVVVV